MAAAQKSQLQVAAAVASSLPNPCTVAIAPSIFLSLLCRRRKKKNMIRPSCCKMRKQKMKRRSCSRKKGYGVAKKR
ncbi:hypothetical protein M0R45_002288 [Rubus argutus]|uniref:Secreted protein n=1 Tax=Rubus argutus TaxID=59490 RepID=A0AAW1VDD8_RUBAR